MGSNADIHPAAATGFARAADAYERGRPGYLHDALDWLVRALAGGSRLTLRYRTEIEILRRVGG